MNRVCIAQSLCAMMFNRPNVLGLKLIWRPVTSLPFRSLHLPHTTSTQHIVAPAGTAAARVLREPRLISHYIGSP